MRRRVRIDRHPADRIDDGVLGLGSVAALKRMVACVAMRLMGFAHETASSVLP